MDVEVVPGYHGGRVGSLLAVGADEPKGLVPRIRLWAKFTHSSIPMANEVTIPILPCRDLDESISF